MTRPITPRILLHSVLLPLLIERFSVVRATLFVPAQFFQGLSVGLYSLTLEFHLGNSFKQKSRE